MRDFLEKFQRRTTDERACLGKLLTAAVLPLRRPAQPDFTRRKADRGIPEPHPDITDCVLFGEWTQAIKYIYCYTIHPSSPDRIRSFCSSMLSGQLFRA